MKTRPLTSALPLACAVLLCSAAAASAQADLSGGTPDTPPVVPVVVPEDAPDASEMRDTPPEPLPPQPPGVESAAGPDDPPPVSQLFPGADEEPSPDISQNVTINLIRILVQKGLLTQTEAVGMIRQAQDEAMVARKTDAARKAEAAKEEDEALRVSYVPEVVRTQMRDEIRTQVLADLRGGTIPGDGKNAPAAVPGMDGEKNEADFFGDIRLRYELASYPEGNDNTGAFPNFNSINSGAPFDTAGLVFSPQRNVDQERQRYRIRVRMGAEFPLEENFSAGVRLATGSDNSPVTTNQTLGGNFNKYAIWLDRAFIRYQKDWSRGSATLLGGRFDNPFFSTDILFDEDLGFDGLALKLKGNIADRAKPFLTAGAFPIYNTDFNFSSNQPAKFESDDKFLFAVQAGTELKLREDLRAKIAVAYYDFQDVEGKLSTPYLPLTSQDAGDTDSRRPSFAQSGNTYMPLRAIIPDALNNFGTSAQYQYFGLASEFKPLSVTGKLDFTGWEPVQISAYAEYIKNTAFNRNEIEPVAVNNRGPLKVDETGAATGLGLFDGDDTAWIAGLKFGKPALEKKWDWTIGANYRWVGSDAVIDGFNDSDFGGGGTNVKGFGIDAALALSRDASIGIRWLSSEEIAGPPLKSDFLFVDFKIKF